MFTIIIGEEQVLAVGHGLVLGGDEDEGHDLWLDHAVGEAQEELRQVSIVKMMCHGSKHASGS